MNKVLRRILSILLCFSLLLTVNGFTTFAESVNEDFCDSEQLVNEELTNEDEEFDETETAFESEFESEEEPEDGLEEETECKTEIEPESELECETEPEEELEVELEEERELDIEIETESETEDVVESKTETETETTQVEDLEDNTENELKNEVIDNLLTNLGVNLFASAPDSSVQVKIDGSNKKGFSGIDSYTYTFDSTEGKKVIDAVSEAMSSVGMTYTENWGYVDSITDASSVTLSGGDVDFGGWSGWTYTYDGASPMTTMAETDIEDGKEIVLTYGYATSIALSGTYKTNYLVGDTFSTENMTATIEYFGSSWPQEIPDGYGADISVITFTGFDSSTTGTKTITASYGGVSTTFDINVYSESGIDWEYDSSSKVLHIKYVGTGSGIMDDYTSYSSTPWSSPSTNRTNATSIVIDDGIKHIGNFAFGSWTKITSVTLPSTLESIGSSAFKSAGATAGFTISNMPASLTKIGDSAFESSKVKTITFEGDNLDLGQAAFKSATKLTTVNNFPSNVSEIKDNTFYSCSALTTLNLPSGLKKVGLASFYECTVLVINDLPASLEDIGKQGFYNCKKLANVTMTNIKTLGDMTFTNCVLLTSATLPSTITKIPPQIFSGCTNLSSINLQGAVTEIGANAFLKTAISSFTIPNTCTTIGNYALECPNLTSITIPPSLTTVGTDIFAKSGTTYAIAPLTDIYYAEGCTTLLGGMLSGTTTDIIVHIPSTVTSVDGQFASGKTSGTLTLDWGSNNNFYIDGGLIYSKDKKKLLSSIPSLVTGSIVINDATIEICDKAFYSNKSITDINLKNVEIVGENAFYACSNMTEVTGTEHIKNVGPKAFQMCSNLSTFNFCDNLVSIGANGFTSTKIGPELILPDSLLTIGDTAFSGCSQVTTLVLSKNLQSMGTQAFGSTKMESVIIPDTITVIPSNAFKSCSNLTTITLPKNLTSIGASAFASDNALVTVYFKGTETEKNAINIATGNDKLIAATWTCNYVEVYVDPPIIFTEPLGASYGLADTNFTPLTISVTSQGGDEESYSYSWYVTKNKEAKDGTLLPSIVSADKLSSTCNVIKDEEGISYYYCVISRRIKTAQGTATSALVYSTYAEIAFKIIALDGTGTKNDPYKLQTYEDFIRLHDAVNSGKSFEGINFIISNDITFDISWDPIGNTVSGDLANPDNGKKIRPFSGTIDGKNHKLTFANGSKPLFNITREANLKNFDIYAPFMNGYALINHLMVDYGSDGNYGSGTGGKYAPGCPDIADIENVNILSGSIIGAGGYVGGFASGGNTITFNKCTVEENVKIGCDASGNSLGLDGVGSFSGMFNGYVLSCKSFAKVYGRKQVGGLGGRKGQSMGPYEFTNCEFYGEVIATGEFAGGISGDAYPDASAPNCDGPYINNCIVAKGAKIEGTNYVGGIIGRVPVIVQSWDNTTFAIKNNLTCATLVCSGSYKAGICPFIRSLNRIAEISNNYYSDDLAVDIGIKEVELIDTSFANPTSISTTTYFNTKNGVSGCPEVSGYQSAGNYFKPGYNRTDDPLGADKDKLSRKTTSDELIDGTIATLLNNGEGSMKNWANGSDHPIHTDELVPLKFIIEGDYKTKYKIDEKIDMSNAVFFVEMIDGSRYEVELKDVTFDGFSTFAPANDKKVTAKYDNLVATFYINVEKNNANTSNQSSSKYSYSGGSSGRSGGGGGGGGGSTLHKVENLVNAFDRNKMFDEKAKLAVNTVYIFTKPMDVNVDNNDTIWQKDIAGNWKFYINDRNSSNILNVTNAFVEVVSTIYVLENNQKVAKSVENSRYYIDNNGYMVTGWVKDIDGSWYFFDTTEGANKGNMLRNAITSDGYFVDANGKWIDVVK